MQPQSPSPREMVLSYLATRRFLGILGFLLPVILVIGSCLTEDSPRTSISDFYHSPNPLIHGFFIGSMCAIGVFLICYRGYDNIDNWITHVAGAAAFGIAIFPTTGDRSDNSFFMIIHYVLAVVFFVVLGVMSYSRFSKGLASSCSKMPSTACVDSLSS